jgi:ribosomal protein RSM22 (predicted rRNA methylase)
LIEKPGTVDVRAAFEVAIERELGDLRQTDLLAAASLLSQRYRFKEAGDGHGFAPGQLQAYLATRAPATFAATCAVLSELRALRPGWAPRTVLDLGAGPGTATWAAAAMFPSLEHAELVEREPDMAALGARLAKVGAPLLLADAAWALADVSQLAARKTDLVVGAYVLGELPAEQAQSALERWWGVTQGELVLVEPGTPAGFERLRAARRTLISWGAQVTAPCPHEEVCPMEGSDWCHFAVRLERSSLHRELKGAKLGYEDEKYSYLAVSASRPRRPVARLLRSPRLHKGHVRLWLCEAGGLTERVISRRDGEIYKRARQARWGERLD